MIGRLGRNPFGFRPILYIVFAFHFLLKQDTHLEKKQPSLSACCPKAAVKQNTLCLQEKFFPRLPVFPTDSTWKTQFFEATVADFKGKVDGN